MQALVIVRYCNQRAMVMVVVILTFSYLSNPSEVWIELRLEKFQNIFGMIFAWSTLWSVSMFVHETKSFEELLRTSAAKLLQERSRKTWAFSTKSVRRNCYC